MDNHYHLVVETPDGNLSKGMRQLKEVYTQSSNRRAGHLFQGRYKAILVDRDSYLLELTRYMVIGAHFGVHFTTVAKVVRRAKGRM
jgi:REP element-mobilizing transposase RayT